MDKTGFFNSVRLVEKPFPLPDAGGKTIMLRELTAAQRSRVVEVAEKDGVRAQAVIIACSCDFLDENNNDDIDRVMAMPSKLVTALSDEIWELSKVTEQAIEDAKKKYEKTQSSDSNTA